MLTDQISRYKNLDFFARQVVEGFITGRHRSPFHGFSVEFSDYRQYNTGESTRNIDWHLYGRTDKLFVKQFEEETNLRCQILVDASSSMLFPLEQHGNLQQPNKLTFAAYSAAVLVELLYRQRDAFGLTLFANDIISSTPCRSNAAHRRHLFAMLDQLLLPPDTDAQRRTTDIAPTLHLIAEQLHRRSLVVIATDALVRPADREPLFDAMRHLRHNKHEVILIHTYDRPHEMELDYDPRPTRFIDLESGNEVRLRPDAVAAAFSAQTHQLHTELHHRCLQYNIDYVPADTSQGFHQIITPFLLRRSKM